MPTEKLPPFNEVQTPEKPKERQTVPVFARSEAELQSVAKLLEIDASSEKKTRQKVQEMLYLLLTPHQLKSLAQILNDQDRGDYTSANKKANRFFGYDTTKKEIFWDPSKVTVSSAMREKLDRFFHQDTSENPNLIRIFKEVVQEVSVANPEDSTAFFEKMEQIDLAYIEAENAHRTFGMIAQFLGDVKKAFQNPTGNFFSAVMSVLNKDHGSSAQSSQQKHAMLLPKPFKPDYSLSYNPDLGDEIRQAAKDFISTGEKEDLKEALTEYVTNIITGHYNNR